MTEVNGEIRKDSIYTLKAFKALTGMGDAAMRQARRDGLTVSRVGRCKFVLGQDWFNYCDACGKIDDQPTPK